MLFDTPASVKQRAGAQARAADFGSQILREYRLRPSPGHSLSEVDQLASLAIHRRLDGSADALRCLGHRVFGQVRVAFCGRPKGGRCAGGLRARPETAPSSVTKIRKRHRLLRDWRRQELTDSMRTLPGFAALQVDHFGSLAVHRSFDGSADTLRCLGHRIFGQVGVTFRGRRLAVPE